MITPKITFDAARPLKGAPAIFAINNQSSPTCTPSCSDHQSTTQAADSISTETDKLPTTTKTDIIDKNVYFADKIETEFCFLGKRHEKDYFNGFVWFGPRDKPKYKYK